MQRRRNNASVSTRNSSLRARSPRLNAVRLASVAVVENLERRQLLSNSIGVNFAGGGNGTQPAQNLQPADMAGLPAVAQVNWNNYSGGSNTGIPIVDNSGNPAGTISNVSTGGTYSSVPGTVTPVGPDQVLNTGFIFGNSDVTVTGIPYAAYDVYIYELGDAAGRVETTTDVNTGQVVTGANPTPGDANHVSGVANTYQYTQSVGTNAGNATPNGDYVLFPLQSGSTFEFKTSAPGNGYLNGFQIVENTSGALGAPFINFTSVPASATSGVALSWGATNATSFDVVRATDSGFTQNVTNIQTGVTTTSTTDNTVAGGTTYFYKVVAHQGASTASASTNGIFVFASSTTNGDGWSAAFFHDQGGGSTNPNSGDPLHDSLLGNSIVPFATKIDPTIDFSGNQNATMDGFQNFNNGANQSIRFDGYIQTPLSGILTFWTGSDDGIQASINEGTDASPNWVTVTQKMRDFRGTGGFNESAEVDTVSAPVAANDTFNSGAPFQFVAGKLYHVEVAMQQGGGGWAAHFGWSGPASGTNTATIIPQFNVTAITPAKPTNVLSIPVAGGGNQISWSDGPQGNVAGTNGAATSFLIESSSDGGATWSSFFTQTASSRPNPQVYSVNDVTGTASTLYRVSAKDVFGQSAPEIAGSVNASVAGTGDGWSADFFTDQGGGSTNGSAQDPLNDALSGNVTTTTSTKIDPTVAFSGGQNNTMDGFPAFNNGANQSVRFDGYLKAPANGVMTFFTGSDDGIQAAINEGTDAAPNWIVVVQKMRDFRGSGTFNENHEVDTVSAPATNDTFCSGSAFQFVAGQLYHVEVAVQNGGGGWGGHLGWSGPASGGLTAGTIIPQSAIFAINPAEPSTINPISGGGVVQVTWTDGPQGTVAGTNGAATGFDIYRANSAAGPYTLLGSTSGNANPNPQNYTFNDTTVSGLTKYFYRVVAKTAYGKSSPLDSTVAVGASPILAVPTQITVVRQADPTQAVVSWGAVAGAASYDVQRATSIDSSGHLVSPTDLGSQTSPFTNTGLNATTDYFYTVQAISTTAGVFNSAVSLAYFVGHGDGWDATYYGFRDGNNTHSVDASNALIGFQRVETSPIDIGNNAGGNPGTNNTGNEQTGPNNAPPQWVATGPNQVLFDPTGTMGHGPGYAFAGRWEGWVEAPVTGFYTFGAASDDGNNVAVYDPSTGLPVVLNSNHINDNRGVPNPPDQAVVTHADLTTAYAFTAGVKYLVQYEFNNGGGGWGAHLSWSASSTAGGSADLMAPTLVPAYDTVAPIPTFQTLDANNPTTPGLTRDQSFYNLSATPNDMSAALKWNNIGATSYNVYALDNTANPGGTPVKLTATPLAATQGAPGSYTATGLINTHSYTFYVTGIDQSGETPVLQGTQATITINPQAPATAPTVTITQDLGVNATADNPLILGNTDTDRVFVTWTAVPFAANYIVTPIQDGVAQTPVTVGNVTSYGPVNLALKHSWTFSVQATNVSGSGPVGTSPAYNLNQGVVEAYYSDQWWHQPITNTGGINNVGMQDNLTYQPTDFFNSGDQNQPNPGSTIFDRTPPGRLGVNYSTVFEGSITAPTTGTYVFGFNSDDSSALMINGQLVAAENGCCDDYPFTNNPGAEVSLSFNAGDKISFIYFMEEGGGGHRTNMMWSINGAAQVTIPPEVLSTIDQGTGVLPNGTPAVPTGVTVTQHTPTSGTFDVAFTDNAINELHYSLIRSTHADMSSPTVIQAGGLFAQTGAHTLQDNSGTTVSGTTYYYQVVASNLYGATPSAIVPVTGTFVNAPTYFSANPGNNMETVLQWVNAPASPGTTVEVQSSPDGVTWTTITSKPVAGTNESLRLTGLAAGSLTYYRIFSTDGTNNSDNSIAEGSIPVAMNVPSLADYSAGFFDPSNLTVNSANMPSAAVQPSGNLRLTDGRTGTARTVWDNTKVAVTSFVTTFDYTANAGTDLADGMTFTLQNDPRGLAALGDGGGSKGIGGGDGSPDGNQVTPSISFGLNPYDKVSQGVLYVNGVKQGTIDLTTATPGLSTTSGAPLNLHSGDTFEVTVDYNGTAAATPHFTATITDVTAGGATPPQMVIDLQAAIDTALAQPTTTPINVPAIVGGSTAFAGFSGGTGGVVENQLISNWTYATQPSANPAPTVQAFTVPNSVEGTAFSSTVNYTGKAGDTFTATVDYGDGGGPSAPFAVTGGSFPIGHAYVEEGSYTVTVVVQDTTNSTSSTPATATATVTGATLGATITGAPAGAISSGTPVNLNFNVTQPNSLEPNGTPSWTITGPAGFTTLTGTSTSTSFTPTIAGTYHVNMTGSESGATDTETGTATQVNIVVNPAAPTYVGTQIDDGNRQKSEIRNLTFKFSSPVLQLTAGSVTLAVSNALNSRSGKNDGSANTDVSAVLDFANATTSDGGMSWTVPFKKSVVIAGGVVTNTTANGTVSSTATDASGSLIDDVYIATVHASLVMDSFGQTLQGGDQNKVFHRLYGDTNNTKKLNNAEFTQFSNTFGLTGGQPGYNRYFDFKGPTVTSPQGSVINNADFTQFSNRFSFLGFVYTASGL